MAAFLRWSRPRLGARALAQLGSRGTRRTCLCAVQAALEQFGKVDDVARDRFFRRRLGRLDELGLAGFDLALDQGQDVVAEGIAEFSEVEALCHVPDQF